MINLQPLIEKFKKAVYGRDVRQSIVDLAQAIGDNHNEQEGLRDEVKSLNTDTKEENKQGKEYITNKKAEMDEAITTGKDAVDSKVSEAVSTIGTKTTEGEQALSAKTQSGISSLEQKTTESTQTVEAVISRANESKAAVDTAIRVAGDSNVGLQKIIRESKSSKTSLESTIQQGTEKDQELKNHITEINKIIADGKAVTKEELKEEILKLKGLSIEVLDTLPESGKAGVIYFIKSTTQSEQKLFDEYAWVNDKWEMLGSKSIDLSQYLEKAEHESFKRYTVGKIGAIKGSVEKLDEQIRANTPLVSVAEPLINSQDSGKKREYYWFVQKTPINCTEAFTQHVKGYCKVVINKNQDALYSLSSESAFEIVIKGWEGTSGSETDECIEIFEQFKFASFDLTRNIAVFKPNIIGIFQDNELLHIKFTVDDIQSAKECLILNIMVEGYI